MKTTTRIHRVNEPGMAVQGVSGIKNSRHQLGWQSLSDSLRQGVVWNLRLWEVGQ